MEVVKEVTGDGGERRFSWTGEFALTVGSPPQANGIRFNYRCWW